MNETSPKNPTAIVCPHCNCKILRANMGTIVTELPMELPNKGGNGSNTYLKWIHVKDMFDFENIGYTKNISQGTDRYLTCADCEMEPIGLSRGNTENFLCIELVKEQQ